MKAFYRFTMSYNLPKQQAASQVTVPKGAEVLLHAALPKVSTSQLRQLMVKTALPAGYPLSGTTPEQAFWQRLDLPAAYALGKSEQSR